MKDEVSSHYSGGGRLAKRIAEGVRQNGRDPTTLEAADLEAVDEFHFRGRAATLELLAEMKLTSASKVLDIGSGLGGVTRTIADTIGCKVTGIDLTEEFRAAAAEMSDWVGLGGKTEFCLGDATNLPFEDDSFDAAITVHVAMNIPNKTDMYREARRILKPGGIFAVYDILKGDGGDMYYPAPWASEPSISYLVTPDEMRSKLRDAGFEILQSTDSTAASLQWLEDRTSQSGQPGLLPVTVKLLFGEEFPAMVQNQLRGLRERRMMTVSLICKA